MFTKKFYYAKTKTKKKVVSSSGQLLDYQEVRYPFKILTGQIEGKRRPDRRQHSWLMQYQEVMRHPRCCYFTQCAEKICVVR